MLVLLQLCLRVHHKCTSSFSVRYQDIQNPMDEIPEIETEPSPHITTDGVHHVPDKAKRLREKVKEKVCEAIRIDPLRPIKEIHEECVNNVLQGIEGQEERIEFCQQFCQLSNSVRETNTESEIESSHRIHQQLEASQLMESSPSILKLASTQSSLTTRVKRMATESLHFLILRY